ncbi:MAG: YaeQ family protein [Bdellovibrionales bacterium]|nr:YaeQ family protein [Bdellovibrionales bacterium]
MALASTLYRFRIDLSDVDRGVYEALDFRAAQHPSETTTYLLTRVIAYALNAQDGLDFSPGGLSDPDQPALQATDGGAAHRVWIEIGNPSAKKLHRAAKSSPVVRVYTYKDPELLVADLAANDVHRSDRIEIFSLPPKFLDRLAETLARDNTWTVLFADGSLSITTGEFSETVDLVRHSVPS